LGGHCRPLRAALSNAERQRRWRERRNALARGHPDITERALLQQAERCERFSDQERAALADKLADAANRHLWCVHELSRVPMKVRTGIDG
jgi:hypothetical protein